MKRLIISLKIAGLLWLGAMCYLTAKNIALEAESAAITNKR